MGDDLASLKFLLVTYYSKGEPVREAQEDEGWVLVAGDKIIAREERISG